MFLQGLYAVMMKIILLCLVERPTKVHRPNLSLPCVVILLCIVFVIICMHPPGLYCEGDCILLVVEMILGVGQMLTYCFI